MFLTDRKLERRISELEQFRYRDIIELKCFVAAEENQGVVNPKLPVYKGNEADTMKASCAESYVEWKTLETGGTWKGRDRFLWLHKDVYIPVEWKGKKLSASSIMAIPGQAITPDLNPCFM